MAENRKIVLEGNDLVKKYGEKYSLNHVNIQIYEGEFLSLLGPSGCGKTTLLKLLAGLDVPTAGVVLRDGKDVTNIPAYGRDSNMVFQNLALFPHMTVWNNVAYGLKVKHVSKPQIKERVERVLKLVQLEEYKDRMPSQLSGGQAQRVAIARALVNEPKVLFLDEPLSALDMKLRVAMQQELRKIQRESGATFVFVTHDQQEAIAISDRIAVLSQGKLQQIGTVPEIFEWSANQFVAEFIGDTNLIPVHLDGYNTDEGNVFTYLDKNTSFCSRYSKNLTTADTENLILSVKHQYVYITKNQTRATNTFRGVVKEANYGGTEYFYEVEVEQGFIMKAAVSIHLNMRQFKVGEQVWLSWEVEDGLLIKAGYDDEE